MISKRMSGRHVRFACVLLFLGGSALGQRSNDANVQGAIDRANARDLDRQRVPDQRPANVFTNDAEELTIKCWDGLLVRNLYDCAPKPAEAQPAQDPAERDRILAERAERDRVRQEEFDREREQALRNEADAITRREELESATAMALESLKQRWDARSVLPSQLGLENAFAQFSDAQKTSYVTALEASYLEGLVLLELAEEQRVRGDIQGASTSLTDATYVLLIACYNDGLSFTPVATAAQQLVTRLAGPDSPYRDLMSRQLVDRARSDLSAHVPATGPPDPEWFYDLDARRALIREMVEREGDAAKVAYERARAEQQWWARNELMGITYASVGQLVDDWLTRTGLPSQQGDLLDAIRDVASSGNDRVQRQATYLSAVFHLEMAEEQRLRGGLEEAARNLRTAINELRFLTVDPESLPLAVVSVDGAARQLYGLVVSMRGPFRTLLPMVLSPGEVDEVARTWLYQAADPPGYWEYDVTERFAEIREMVKRDDNAGRRATRSARANEVDARRVAISSPTEPSAVLSPSEGTAVPQPPIPIAAADLRPVVTESPQPGAAEEQFIKGLSLVAKLDFSGALPFYAEAVRLAPESAAYRHQLGHALHRAGRSAEGVHHLKRATELDPGNWLSVEQLADAQTASGSPEAALATLEKALVSWPGNTFLEDAKKRAQEAIARANSR